MPLRRYTAGEDDIQRPHSLWQLLCYEHCYTFSSVDGYTRVCIDLDSSIFFYVHVILKTNQIRRIGQI